MLNQLIWVTPREKVWLIVLEQSKHDESKLLIDITSLNVMQFDFALVLSYWQISVNLKQS